jgi:hypothetical protein
MFTMSGTSQAAAVTSGVVALMLQSDPSLTPDAVKCRLLASTRPAVTSGGSLAYSVFQQGAGLINAPAAVNSSATNCANQGLDINADLAGTRHFGGPANQDANGNYYIMDLEGGTTWASPLAGDGAHGPKGMPGVRAIRGLEGYTWTQGYYLGEGYTWTQGYTWAKGHVGQMLHVGQESAVVDRLQAGSWNVTDFHRVLGSKPIVTACRACT